jgi:hypothetical protein
MQISDTTFHENKELGTSSRDKMLMKDMNKLQESVTEVDGIHFDHFDQVRDDNIRVRFENALVDVHETREKVRVVPAVLVFIYLFISASPDIFFF